MDENLPLVTPRTTATGTTLYEGVTYAYRQGHRPLLLDLHVPAAAGPVPVVVWMHGGAFWSGDRRYLPDTVAPGAVFDALTAAGLAVATIDYRLSGEAQFPAQLDDVREALAHLRAHGAALGLDTGRLGLWGESAGGTLAALAALTGGGVPDGGVSAVVLWYTPTDLSVMHPDNPDGPEGRLIGGAPALLPEAAAQASPVTHVSPGAPPFLLLHGADDDQVPTLHSARLHALLAEAGVPSTYLPVDGAGHCFAGYPDVPGLIDASVAFLAGQLAAGA
ncbi:hypothetical protein KNE206_16340 [Kitasatospora sp. NE20-6]|uniref:alpha/beta hydrolase fold domain-containing protein n=1 Tax=Kitasatospora sp. NE20-6 TaxID=2859066 RepID=UPI0034DC2570